MSGVLPVSYVELGFLQEIRPWCKKSYNFLSKAGGKPAWLSLDYLPTPEDLQCPKCSEALIFLFQVYAPYEDVDDEIDDYDNYHRTLFVFICRNPPCCQRNSSENLKVFRSSLRRHNKFYPAEPPIDEEREFPLPKWLTLCNLCGCLAEKRCGKCKKVSYCNRAHQVLDWKEGHKKECQSEPIPGRISTKLFPEGHMIVEEEEDKEEKPENTEDQFEKWKLIQRAGKEGTMPELSESELEKHAAALEDLAFTEFRDRIVKDNDQVLRYQRGGQPLWIALYPKPDQIPNCQYCGSERQFEFQIMPQLLSFWKEYKLDWGVIVVYTCKKSCSTEDGYKSEFVFKQDVLDRHQ